MQATAVTFIFLLLLAVSTAGTLQDGASQTHVRAKRQTTCAQKFQVFSGHTACLSVQDTAGVSAADKKVIVDKHNEFRAAVNPPATNMRKMEWDDEVAMIAQKWADNCNINHDTLRFVPGRFGVGQNLASGSGDWAGAITMWHNEVTKFTYNDSNMNTIWVSIAHYTQVVWASTSKVGCGFNPCGTKKFYVCNYAPAGNLATSFHTPYLSGTSCSACAGHCPDGKLCDCGLTCLNDGKLDLATCKCSCLQNYPFYAQPDCSMNCTGTRDPTLCSNAANSCPTYKNYCPFKCQICPYAEPDYVGPAPSTPSAPGAAVLHKTIWQPTVLALLLSLLQQRV